MLDNTELIETLDETKSKATEVSEKLEMAAKTSIDIDKLRDGWVTWSVLSCDTISSTLYILLISLALRAT